VRLDASLRRHGRNDNADDLLADPFGELRAPLGSRRFDLLGSRFEFESNSPRLLELADAAYAGVPRQRLSGAQQPLRISLWLCEEAGFHPRNEPPPLLLCSGRSFLAGASPHSNLVIVCPRERSALVVVSRAMLRHPYHVRYELIEFAVFSLAARAHGLVPLHAACVGQGNRGILLMGPSGAGKSTLSLLWMLRGLKFVAEDSVFVAPERMTAVGIANFLHVRAATLRHVTPANDAAALRRLPRIRRRSGVQKLEIDVRRAGWPVARAPLEIAAVVFVSPHRSPTAALLTPLRQAEMLGRLDREQPYAAGRPEWPDFRRKLASVTAVELRRGNHPLESIEALRRLLEAKSH
jgi:hypothetical protein